MSIPAIFLDRDGTLNIDHGYVYEIEKFEFIEGVIEACEKLNKMGYALFIVTNQSGIARGYYTEEQFLSLTEWMDWSLADRNVEISAVYYCPHSPDSDCECRKPKPGMLLSAQKEFKIDFARSYMVGDKIEDMLAGKAAGIKTVLVKTGKPVTEEAKTKANHIIESVANLPALLKEM